MANASDGRPPSRPILVTFDDGDPSVLHTAAPRLYARNPGSHVLITDLIGTDHVLWTTEVVQLVASGGRTTSSTQRATAVRSPGFSSSIPIPSRQQVIEELRDTASGPRPRARQLSAPEIARLTQLGMAI